jgi:hypothetical protein
MQIKITALAVCLAGALSAGTPGSLDPTFGQDGVVADIDGPFEAAVAMLVQPDGKIVYGSVLPSGIGDAGADTRPA